MAQRWREKENQDGQESAGWWFEPPRRDPFSNRSKPRQQRPLDVI